MTLTSQSTNRLQSPQAVSGSLMEFLTTYLICNARLGTLKAREAAISGLSPFQGYRRETENSSNQPFNQSANGDHRHLRRSHARYVKAAGAAKGHAKAADQTRPFR